VCYTFTMVSIPHRELRNRSGEVLRRAEAGERLTITVGGRPVAQIGPVPQRQPWVSRAELLALLAGGTPDPDFFDDLAEMSGDLEGLDERSEEE
jgi:prevent-host-death family protein